MLCFWIGDGRFILNGVRKSHFSFVQSNPAQAMLTLPDGMLLIFFDLFLILSLNNQSFALLQTHHIFSDASSLSDPSLCLSAYWLFTCLVYSSSFQMRKSWGMMKEPHKKQQPSQRSSSRRGMRRREKRWLKRRKRQKWSRVTVPPVRQNLSHLSL